MTARISIFTIAILLLASAAFAQEPRRQPDTSGPSALQSHAARLEHGAAGDIEAGRTATGQFVDLDIVFPTDKAEYEALGKYAVMVFTLFSDDRAELPLAQAYAGGVALKCFTPVFRDVPQASATAKAFGKFRADTLCVLPIGVKRKSNIIIVDFNRGPKGLVVYSDTIEEPAYMKADTDPHSLPAPDSAILGKLIFQEYPGFGFGEADTGTSHAVDSSPTSYGATTLASFDKRIEDSATDYQKEYPSSTISRFMLFDSALPRDAAEYIAIGKNGVLLVAAISHDEGELPLASVYMGGVKLKRLGAIRRKTAPGSAAMAEFGPYREDSFYLVPIDRLRKDPTVTADFAKNRSGFLVGKTDLEEPDFMAKDRLPRSDPAPSIAAIKTLIDREYPGFGIELSP